MTSRKAEQAPAPVSITRAGVICARAAPALLQKSPTTTSAEGKLQLALAGAGAAPKNLSPPLEQHYRLSL